MIDDEGFFLLVVAGLVEATARSWRRSTGGLSSTSPAINTKLDRHRSIR